MSQVKPSDDGQEIHFSFVEMLFALAIAEVAIQVANLIQFQNYGDYLPAYAHLVLATIIIATSWVGWRQSPYGGSKVTTIFSLNFIELLIDVVLVICYFVLTRSVESPDKTGRLVASAEDESLWVMIIMFIYVVWDLVSKQRDWNRWFQRGWASLACAVLAGIGHWVILPSQSDKRLSVMLCDASLLSLVVLFRATKRNEWYALQRSDWLWIGISFILWVGFSLAAHFVKA